MSTRPMQVQGGGGFGRPSRGVLVLLVMNVAVYVVQLVLLRTGVPLREWLYLWPASVLEGRVWQVATYALFHREDAPSHLLFNMLFLWWMGSMLERAIGARRLWITYAVAGVSGGLFTVLVAALAETPVLSWLLPNFASRPHVGASGAVMGVTIAWGIVFADQVMQFFLLGAMKARTFMWILVGIELLVALSWDPTSSSAHFGGMLAGWVIAKDLWRPSHWSEKARRRKLLAERQRIERELRIIEGGKKDDLPN